MYVTVEVEQGILRGQQKTSDYFSHKKYFSFQGIPYAKPPLGPLRFKAPEEPETWSGIRDALKEGSDCSQFDITTHLLIGSEDCLYLNVYTPQLDCNLGLPVMVWVHGGGFFAGSGSTEVYGPDYLIEHDVIIVTINYRLGALGFLCLGHNEVPGNAGLKDQVMAFRWVQKNIVKFGGDPNRVTIFGESAGAGSVSYHLVSPLSQGLFQYAIVQSGSVLNPWACIDRAAAIDRAFRLGKALGCDTKDTNELLKFLREVPDYDILTNTNILREDEDGTGLNIVFLPCIEEPATSQSFIPCASRKLLEQGKFAKIPTIVGTTSAEGIISCFFIDLSEGNLLKVYEKIEKFIIQDLGVDVNSDKAKQISKELRQFYFGDSPVTVEKIDNFFELYGDLLFDHGIDECVRLTVQNKEAAPLYAYEFTHCLSSSFVKVSTKTMNCNFKGVNHGEDLSVLFNHALESVAKPNTEEQEFIAQVTKMWTTFAKTGNPNYSGMEAVWEPVRKNNFCHLDIGRKLKLVPERTKQQRMVMWQQLYEKYQSTH